MALYQALGFVEEGRMRKGLGVSPAWIAFGDGA